MAFDLENIAFSYGAKPVIDALSLALEPGRFHGIVGPNGCGKTTLLELLGGLRRLQAGSIRYNGRELSGYSRRQLAREIAFVPQNFYINFPFAVHEVVMMGRHPYIPRFSAPSARDEEIVAQVMESSGIRPMAGRLVTQLSGGERQRVVFARALAQQTPVLILDEATSNLDVAHAMRLLAIARCNVDAQGQTVVGVFQDINQAAAWCDRLIFMSAGRIIAQGKIADVLSADTLQAVFGVQARVYFESFSGAFQAAYRFEPATDRKAPGGEIHD